MRNFIDYIIGGLIIIGIVLSLICVGVCLIAPLVLALGYSLFWLLTYLASIPLLLFFADAFNWLTDEVGYYI